MWNKPHLLNAIADLLMLVAAAALLAAGAVWLVRVPSLPVKQVVFAEPLPHTKRGEVEQVLPGSLKGNFFSLNLEQVRGSLEKLPWVRKVDVRRQWPDRLEIMIEEHKPVARWGEGRGELVNSYGEVFAAAFAGRRGERAALALRAAGHSTGCFEALQRVCRLLCDSRRKAGAGHAIAASGLAAQVAERHVGGHRARTDKSAGRCASAAVFGNLSGNGRQTGGPAGSRGFAVSEWFRHASGGRGEGKVSI